MILKCPNCNYQSEIPKNWKVFNTVICPKCFTNIDLPWCKEKSDLLDPVLIVDSQQLEQILLYLKKENERKNE